MKKMAYVVVGVFDVLAVWASGPVFNNAAKKMAYRRCKAVEQKSK
jgi:hypothetical protein